jgi:hypothetical protein
MAKLFRTRVSTRRMTAAVLTVVSLQSVQLTAQIAASLQGQITDASGAAVAKARIVLVDEATSVVRTTTSDVRGQYRFDVLPIGSYSLRIE